MSLRLPLYEQENRNTCALASLRMVLAAFGTDVEESTLESQARLEEDGTVIGELERLARQFGLVAEIQEATVKQLRQFLAEGKLAMAYIDRAVFELTPRQRAKHSLRAAKMHVIVPTRITAQAITYHDPRPSARIVRKSIRLFRSAYERLGSRCVVCSKPEEV
jgi:ABC-type bacteriocin/lantibiotic exporter with double-glycine peptidase domain